MVTVAYIGLFILTCLVIYGFVMWEPKDGGE